MLATRNQSSTLLWCRQQIRLCIAPRPRVETVWKSLSSRPKRSSGQRTKYVPTEKMAPWWAQAGTEVLFTPTERRFNFLGEQFWGRAARASADSKESGRLLIFGVNFSAK